MYITRVLPHGVSQISKSVTRYTSDIIVDNISGIVTNIKGQ